ncbi:MAG: RIP metalloprotease RseP [Gammaproteobacteria bacterium]|nr:RIP metalloprotease RseP [Gammaproteobacteria bacterium]
MFDVLFTIISFLVAISVLIAIHEFGHFWVAKKAGVKILRYSIGFGKPLWIKRFGEDQTEFVLASLPLGGFVKMLDGREGDVPEAEAHRAFDKQPLSKRFAIVFAGPLFNFLFAIFAYWLVFVVGITGVKPVVGDVEPDTPAAQAGFQSGMEIIQIENKLTPIWDVALETLLPVMVDHGSVKVTLAESEGQQFETQLNLQNTEQELEPGNIFKILGFTPLRPSLKPVVGGIIDEYPAQKAGLLENDHIIMINNEAIYSWEQLVEVVSSSPDTSLSLRVRRAEQEIDLTVHTRADIRDGKEVGLLGIRPFISNDNRVVYRYGALEAIQKSLEKTWNNTTLTLKMLGKIITGEVSIKNLSGPVNIAVYAGHSASAGFSRFFDFLAIVSISLGILNLLPIPVLDGGHLMYYVIEGIKGSPVSEKTEIIGQQIGIAILVLLMSMALYNDLVRLLN